MGEALSKGARIVFRTPDKGLCVGLVVRASRSQVKVRLWYWNASGHTCWSPRPRLIARHDILGEATPREVRIGLAVDHNRVMLGNTPRP